MPKGFQKGNTEASKKGAHQKTKQWEALGESIMTVHTDRFNSILETSTDQVFLDNYMKILEYFKPKLARTETDLTSGGEKISVPITAWVDDEKK
jgi:hypothetical protein